MARLGSILLLATAALALVPLGGCRRGPAGTTTVVVIGDEAPALGDPLRSPANEGEAVLRMATAQGLVRFDAAGQIEPGVAERWNVSDDGLSYIFRLATGEWDDERKISARQVARLIEQQRKADSADPSRDLLGAVDEAVAMTDRVIEIRLRAPRPNLLTLLAQPDFALIRSGHGSGPFRLRKPDPDDAEAKDAPLVLRRRLPGLDGEEGEREEVRLSTLPAAKAIAAFKDGQAAVVLGGTVTDLPLATSAQVQRGTLRFDPVAGLFGLVPARKEGPAAETEIRKMLSQAIDRQALIAELAVPGLTPRATVLQGGLDGLGDPPQPAWLAQPVTERRADLLAMAGRLRKDDPEPGEPPQPTRIGIALPEGPGGDVIMLRLNRDWGPLGFEAVRAGNGVRADFRLVDLVAPSDSPAWYLRRFRCDLVPICLEKADELLASAREAPIAVQRAGLFAEAARLIDEGQLFIPIAAPIRWALVSRDAPGFVENRYARHPLGGLTAKFNRRSDQ